MLGNKFLEKDLESRMKTPAPCVPLLRFAEA